MRNNSHNENLKMLAKEAVEDNRRWKNLPRSWIGWTILNNNSTTKNCKKMSTQPKLNLEIQHNCHQILVQFFTEFFNLEIHVCIN